MKPQTAGEALISDDLRLTIAAMNYYPAYSGAGTRFRRYIPGFVERGVSVDIVAGTPDTARSLAQDKGNGWREFRRGSILPAETVDGIPIRRVRLPDDGGLRRDAWFSWRVADLCGRRQPRPEVVQLFSIPLTSIPALWRIRRFGIPTVATQTIMPTFSAHPVRRQLMKTFFGVSSRLVTCVVASSEVMVPALREQGIRTRIEVIPHGVDTKRFRPAANQRERLEIRRRLSIPNSHTILLFVGSIVARKGVDLLLRAWCELAVNYPNLHLVLIGPLPNPDTEETIAYQSQLEALAQRSGGHGRIHFLGRVENVEPYMRCADVFVFPSRREGMPNAMLEAMASGLPIVTTPFDGFPREFGDPGRQFVQTTFDPVRMAADVAALLEAPLRRNELGNNARIWIENHLDVQHILDRYVNLYAELARSGSRTRCTQRRNMV